MSLRVKPETLPLLQGSNENKNILNHQKKERKKKIKSLTLCYSDATTRPEIKKKGTNKQSPNRIVFCQFALWYFKERRRTPAWSGHRYRWGSGWHCDNLLPAGMFVCSTQILNQILWLKFIHVTRAISANDLKTQIFQGKTQDKMSPVSRL